jgi:hypothetical protein
MGLRSGGRDPRSESRIGKKPIPDPGSRGQKGRGSQIPDTDPQHYSHGEFYELSDHPPSITS